MRQPPFPGFHVTAANAVAATRVANDMPGLPRAPPGCRAQRYGKGAGDHLAIWPGRHSDVAWAVGRRVACVHREDFEALSPRGKTVTALFVVRLAYTGYRGLGPQSVGPWAVDRAYI